jgi:serine/threonine protein kinase
MPEPQRSVGRYDLLEVIGRGGAAVVHLAYQRDLRRHVALKELSRHHAADPNFAERFVEESRLAGSMSHPSIVTVHEFFEYDEVPYIAMEHLPRGSLRPYVGRLSVAQIAGVLESVLAGLSHGEEQGIVHRDLKPENLLVAADGRVKISDFGVARAYNEATTRAVITAAGTTIGTPAYMAPEQALGERLTPATDLYSLGIVAWEMLAGTVPFEQTDTPVAVLYRQVHEPVPPIRSVDADVDERLADWLDKLLVKRPADRFARADLAWDELEDIVIELLGPRWRREARLGPDPPAPDRHPLTPAQFESVEQRKTPGAADSAAAEQADPPPPPPAVTAARPRIGQPRRPVSETIADDVRPAPETPQAPERPAAPADAAGAAGAVGQETKGPAPQPSAGAPPGTETVLRPGRRHHLPDAPATSDRPPDTGGRRGLIAVLAGVLVAAIAGVIIGLATSGNSPAPRTTPRTSSSTTPAAPSDAPVKAALVSLADARSRGLRRLRAAHTARRQAAALATIAGAYRTAAGAVARLPAAPAALTATLRTLTRAYGSLAASARATRADAYRRAEAQAARAEKRLRVQAARL